MRLGPVGSGQGRWKGESFVGGVRRSGHGVSGSLFIFLVADSICSMYLVLSNIRFENEDPLREKKKGSTAA